MKTPAAKDTLVSLPNPRTSIFGDVLNTRRKSVLAPLPDIPGHVEETELIRLLLGDIMSVIAPLAVIPSH
jgi:hypothetical protein